MLSGIPDNVSKDPRRQVTNSGVNDSLNPTNPPSKLVKLNNGRPMPSPKDENMETSGSGPSQVFSTAGKQILKIEEASSSERQATQVLLFALVKLFFYIIFTV